MKSEQFYEKITNEVIEKLEEGTGLWSKSWASFGLPLNGKSTNKYKGANLFMLYFFAEHETPVYFTFNQAKEFKGNVIKGSTGYSILFYKTIYQVIENGKPRILSQNEADKRLKKGEKLNEIPCPKRYTVFNIEQIENHEYDLSTLVPIRENNEFSDCEGFVAEFLKKQDIKLVNGECASYSPISDVITMPKIERFESSEEYYSTLFHEIIHATGEKKRLGRYETHDTSLSAYSKEELVAELGSLFLCGHFGFNKHVEDNSTAYLNGWVSKLKEDSKFIFQSSSQAQAAVNFLLN